MKHQNTISTKIYHSPCGDMLLGAFEGRLCLCDWTHGLKYDSTADKLKKALKAGFVEENSMILDQAIKELDEFFAGSRTEFDVPLLFVGTDFQKTVWKELMNIPYGATISYGELARRIGRPTAVRAIANSNARNPISIFAPCHRVIGSDRTLTGYGGGLHVKKFLLDLENQYCSL